MSPNTRTSTQRDRKFARVRRVTQTILVSSGVASGVMVGFVAANTKPVTTIPVVTHQAPAPTTTVHPTTPVKRTTTAPVAPTTTYVAPTTVPAAPAPVCYTTPSGTTVCH